MHFALKRIVNSEETLRYVGLTFVVKKETGVHFRDEYFRKEFSLNSALIDYCDTSKEKAYFKGRKEMIVLLKQTQKKETILIDESDKMYSAVTFLYPSLDISESKIACDFLSKIGEDIRVDELLKYFLENSMFIFVGRYLFQGSEEEKEMLIPQNRHVKVYCEDMHNIEIIVDKMTHDKVPVHDCWKNPKDLHKIIADNQSKEALRFFYLEKFLILEEDVKSFQIEAPFLSTDDFYQKWYLLQKETLQIQHKQNTVSIENDLAQIKSRYESQSHLAIQKSLSETQRRLLLASILSVVLSAVIIATVGYYQINVTKEIGLKQIEIEAENLPDLKYYIDEPQEIPYDGSKVPLDILVSNPLHSSLEYTIEVIGEGLYVQLESDPGKSLDLEKEVFLKDSLQGLQTKNLKFLLRGENIWAPLGKTVTFQVKIHDLVKNLTIVDIRYSYILQDVGSALDHEYKFILIGFEFPSS